MRINEGITGELFDGMFTTNKAQDPRLKTRSELIVNKKAFCPAEICQYELELSPNAIPIGLKIIDDETWNIPLLDSCIKDTEAYKQIAPNHRRNMHIVAINGVRAHYS